MYTTIQILITYFATMSGPLGAPDACSVVNENTKQPAYCGPHHIGAPVYDDNICCSGSGCLTTYGDGTCDSDEVQLFCELGEVDALGGVSCYFEVPDYCDVHVCLQAEELPEVQLTPETADYICCAYDVCMLYNYLLDDGCVGDIYFCMSLVSYGDDTVGCIDWEED